MKTYIFITSMLISASANAATSAKEIESTKLSINKHEVVAAIAELQKEQSLQTQLSVITLESSIKSEFLASTKRTKQSGPIKPSVPTKSERTAADE